jgi:hypothetical protein
MLLILCWRIFTLTVSATISILCAALLAFSAVSQAEARPLNYTASGSFESAVFVFPDGKPSESITLAGSSTAGPITLHQWIAASLNGNTCTLPGGVSNTGKEGTFTDSFAVIRFACGDLLVQTLVSGTFCIDLSSPGPLFPFAGVLTVENTGGTGKYAGATGTETLNFVGQQLFGSTGAIGFVTQTEAGVVNTP